MTTSPRVALCVVLGSWGALLVAAGVAGERQTHSSSYRLCQAPLAAGIEIRGAAALAGIHLDYLYTDDACGHSAPLSSCGMTVCCPMNRPADQIAKTPAPLDDFADNYDSSYYESDSYKGNNYDDSNYDGSDYESEKYVKDNYGIENHAVENYDDEAKYYEVLGEEYTPTIEARKPNAIADSRNDVYYDDLRGAYIPSDEAHKSISTDNSDWNDGAKGWYADPQDTDSIDANIWETDKPNVDAPRTQTIVDEVYYGEDDPCDEWVGQHDQPRVASGSLSELARSPWHTIGQALAIQLNFENDGLPKVHVPATAQVLAQLMGIEALPKLPGWMTGKFAFDEDWHGCNMAPNATSDLVQYPARNVVRYPASDLEAYPSCEMERLPAVIPDSVWTENRIHSTSSFIWDETDNDYCHPSFDCQSEVDQAISLEVRREIIRLGMIPTVWAATTTWNNYRAVWNDIAGGMGQLAHEVAMTAPWTNRFRSAASANRPVRTQSNLHLGL
jgi:hypothetical protein